MKRKSIDNVTRGGWGVTPITRFWGVKERGRGLEDFLLLDFDGKFFTNSTIFGKYAILL